MPLPSRATRRPRGRRSPPADAAERLRLGRDRQIDARDVQLPGRQIAGDVDLAAGRAHRLMADERDVDIQAIERHPRGHPGVRRRAVDAALTRASASSLRTAATGKRSARTAIGSAAPSPPRSSSGVSARSGSSLRLGARPASPAPAWRRRRCRSPRHRSRRRWRWPRGRPPAIPPARRTRAARREPLARSRCPRSEARCASPWLSPASSIHPLPLRKRAGPSERPSPTRARTTISFSARSVTVAGPLPRGSGDDSDKASSDSLTSAFAGWPGAIRAAGAGHHAARLSPAGSGGRNGSSVSLLSVSVTSPSRPAALGPRRPSTAMASIRWPRARTAPCRSGEISACRRPARSSRW